MRPSGEGARMSVLANGDPAAAGRPRIAGPAGLLGLVFLLLAAAIAAPEPGVVVLEVRGVIGPAVSDYLGRGIRQAEANGAALIVIEIDTPGGLDGSMRDIIQSIIASPVPVASYVHPGGARAASAGTYILYASHVAAMTPATNLGAATPVQIGGMPGSDPSPDEGGSGAEAPRGAMERKIVNDAVAYIRGLARMHGRNADWAERAVREGASLAAEEALDEEVIDLVVPDLRALLEALDGRTVAIGEGERTLATRDAAVVRQNPDWRARLLAVITDPNVAYILMLIGVYGLIYELASPGMIFPGVMGAISLLVALYAFQVLPVNFAGLGLIALGISFMLAELFLPSFGMLGIGGIISFVIGSIMLIDTGVPGFELSGVVITALALLTTFFFIVIIGMVIRSRKRPVVTGLDQLVGARVVAVEDFTGRGRVRYAGELWNARSEQPLRRGGQATILAVEGLLLVVQPAPDEDLTQEES